MRYRYKLFVLIGEGCVGKSTVALWTHFALQRGGWSPTIIRKDTTREQRADAERARMDAMFYNFVTEEYMADATQYVSVSHGVEGLYGIRKRTLDAALQVGPGILIQHPSGIAAIRDAGYDLRVIHIVAQHRPAELDTRSERRRAFDEREFATLPPVDAVFVNSFRDNGDVTAGYKLSTYISRHVLSPIHP